MATIGALTVTYLWGRVDEEAMALEVLTRPGVHGFAAARVGNRALPTSLETVLVCADLAAAVAHYAAAKALVGADPVTITYDDGTTVAEVQVLGVEWGSRRIQEVLNAVGASGTREAWLVWTVIHRGVSES